MPKTASWPSNSVSVAPLRSWLPVSTPTTRCTGMRLLAHPLDEHRQQPRAVVCDDHGGDDLREVRCVL